MTAGLAAHAYEAELQQAALEVGAQLPFDEARHRSLAPLGRGEEALEMLVDDGVQRCRLGCASFSMRGATRGAGGDEKRELACHPRERMPVRCRDRRPAGALSRLSENADSPQRVISVHGPASKRRAGGAFPSGPGLPGPSEKGGESTEVDELVTGMGQALVEASGPQPFRYRFYVIVDAISNAFAIPGGHIYLHTGSILTAPHDAELAPASTPT